MPRKRFRKLLKPFYQRPTLLVAPEMLGKYLVYQSPRGRLSARIVEAEAYIGREDPACHAAAGQTERNRTMFGPGGFTYIYFIYGMYYCLNFVTETEGLPAAVLVRAAEPDEGLDLMSASSPGGRRRGLLSGPGKLCRAFNLTRNQNGLDLTGDVMYLEDRFADVRNLQQSTRIGIKVGTELPWRFFDADSPAVSNSATRDNSR